MSMNDSFLYIQNCNPKNSPCQRIPPQTLLRAPKSALDGISPTAGLCCFNMDPSLGHRSTLHFKPAHPMIHPQITHHQTLLPFTLWPDHHLECPRMQRRPRIFQDSFAASVRFLASLALGVDDLGVGLLPQFCCQALPLAGQHVARSARKGSTRQAFLFVLALALYQEVEVVEAALPDDTCLSFHQLMNTGVGKCPN